MPEENATAAQAAGGTQRPAPISKQEAKAELPTVTQHANALFPVNGELPDGTPRRPRDFWRHAAASILHGWAEHAHHEGAEMRLSREDYLKALDVAAPAEFEGEGKSRKVKEHGGVYEPHKAALSRHSAHARRAD